MLGGGGHGVRLGRIGDGRALDEEGLGGVGSGRGQACLGLDLTQALGGSGIRRFDFGDRSGGDVDGCLGGVDLLLGGDVIGRNPGRRGVDEGEGRNDQSDSEGESPRGADDRTAKGARSAGHGRHEVLPSLAGVEMRSACRE